jgi:hypothetical protein
MLSKDMSAATFINAFASSVWTHAIFLSVLPMVESLFNLHLEVVEVGHVLLDLWNWQLDKHTGDLGGLLIADELLNELVDAATDLLLQVRVVWVQGWDVLHGLGGVLLSNRHAVWVHLHVMSWWYHWHVRVWHILLVWWWWSWHLLLLLLLLMMHLSFHLVHLHVLLLVHMHVLLHLLLLLMTHVLLALVLHVVATTHSLVVVTTHMWSWPIVLVWASSGSVHITLVHLLVGLFIVLDDTEQLLEHLSQVWLRCQVIPLESSGLLGLVFFPIGLVTSFFHL